MKRKIVLLIAGCIITVAALACIQGYFIYNTYLLNVQEADHKVRQKLLSVEVDGELDSLNSAWMKKVGEFIAFNVDSPSRGKNFEKLIRKIEDSLSAAEEDYIKSRGLVGDFDVSYNNYVRKVVLQKEGSQATDTLFSGKLLLFGNTPKGGEEILASQSKWTDNLRTPEGRIYALEFTTERTYCIDNWKSAIITKMGGMLLFTVLLLAFVILLFYLSIKGLITQKKIADIKSDFINNITHEFKTPIAVMDLAVKTLEQKENDLTTEQFENTLSIIGRQNKRMKKLFDQVSGASLGTSATKGHAENLTFADVETIVDDFRLAHPEAAISFNGDRTSFCRMDRQHLATVLHNLLDNAVKYGGTIITVNFASDEGKCSISVTDNGIGIPPKEKPAIFEKFYRVQKGDVHTTKGLGLGLFYVKQVADAYDGSITVESSKDGSTFTLTIPKL